jgi:hypothetical protein
MDIYEFNRVFFKFACPFLLVATPLFLFGLFNAPNPPEQHVGPGWFIFFSVAGAGVMGASFWYCRTKLGWFGGKKAD